MAHTWCTVVREVRFLSTGALSVLRDTEERTSQREKERKSQKQSYRSLREIQAMIHVCARVYTGLRPPGSLPRTYPTKLSSLVDPSLASSSALRQIVKVSYLRFTHVANKKETRISKEEAPTLRIQRRIYIYSVFLENYFVGINNFAKTFVSLWMCSIPRNRRDYEKKIKRKIGHLLLLWKHENFYKNLPIFCAGRQFEVQLQISAFTNNRRAVILRNYF